LHRLPWVRIVRADVVNKVSLKENPGAANLRAGQATHLGALAHFLAVHMQKGCCLRQVERDHGGFVGGDGGAGDAIEVAILARQSAGELMGSRCEAAMRPSFEQSQGVDRENYQAN
jgi:hypothetical protein